MLIDTSFDVYEYVCGKYCHRNWNRDRRHVCSKTPEKKSKKYWQSIPIQKSTNTQEIITELKISTRALSTDCWDMPIREGRF